MQLRIITCCRDPQHILLINDVDSRACSYGELCWKLVGFPMRRSDCRHIAVRRCQVLHADVKIAPEENHSPTLQPTEHPVAAVQPCPTKCPETNGKAGEHAKQKGKRQCGGLNGRPGMHPARAYHPTERPNPQAQTE